MAGYTPLFSSIVMSTIWREDHTTRIVWITMLALADQFDHVDASVPGLADAARVTIEECQSALEKLSNPDPFSRSQEEGGRRILPRDGGWLIVNRGKYKEKARDRAKYMREYRNRLRNQNVTNVTAANRCEPLRTAANRRFPSTSTVPTTTTSSKKVTSVTSVPTTSPKRESEPCVEHLKQEGLTSRELLKQLLDRFTLKGEKKIVVGYITEAISPTKTQAFIEHGTLDDSSRMRKIISELIDIADGKQITYKWEKVPLCDHETLIRTISRAARETKRRFNDNNFLKSGLILEKQDPLPDIYGEK